MLNEVQEFNAYTQFPSYAATDSDASYLGRFTVESIRDFLGFDRIFAILARGYLFRDGCDPYERTEYTRRALCAWCSIPERSIEPKDDWEFATAFPELHKEFPELVDRDGRGWYIRHLHNIVAFSRENPKQTKAGVKKYVTDKVPELEDKWWNKVRQFQIPIFLEGTDAIWQIRFDDIIANALTLGPLREMEVEVSEQQKEKLLSFLDTDVKLEHLTTLIAYYKANKPEDTDWVVLPSSNFNNYFGSTVFSKKVVPRITDTLILRSDTSYGTGRFRVKEEYL